jgi:hypothetical protein
MSINTIHRLDKLVFPAGVEIAVLKNAKWSAGIQSLIHTPAGGIYPMFRANQLQKPLITFATPQLDILLGAVGPSGVGVSGINTYYKLGNVTGNVARATATHMRVAVSLSCVHWSTIRLTDKKEGEAQVQITATYDGANAPFVYTGSVALTGTLVAGSFFGAGPVKINSVSIPGIQEITIDSGIKLVQLGDSSEDYDTFVGIEQAMPSITVKTLELVNWASFGLQGTPLDGANGIVCYGRKFSNGGSRVGNATAQHLMFQGLNGTCVPQDTDGSGSSPMSDTLKVELTTTSDVVNPITVSTASTIT